MSENKRDIDLARLKEETKILQNYLIKHGHDMPKSSKDVMMLRLISFQKIIKGDKPNDFP